MKLKFKDVTNTSVVCHRMLASIQKVSTGWYSYVQVGIGVMVYVLHRYTNLRNGIGNSQFSNNHVCYAGSKVINTNIKVSDVTTMNKGKSSAAISANPLLY